MSQTNRQKREKQHQLAQQNSGSGIQRRMPQSEAIAPIEVNDFYQWGHKDGRRQGVLDALSKFEILRKREQEFQSALSLVERTVNAIALIIGLMKDMNRDVIPRVLKADALLREDGKPYSVRLSSDIQHFLNKYRAVLDTREIDQRTWEWVGKWSALAASVGQLEELPLDGMEKKDKDRKLKSAIETVHEDLHHVTGKFYEDILENVNNRNRGGDSIEAYRLHLVEEYQQMRAKHPKIQARTFIKVTIGKFEAMPEASIEGSWQHEALENLRAALNGDPTRWVQKLRKTGEKLGTL